MFINIRELFLFWGCFNVELRRVIPKTLDFQELHRPRGARIQRSTLQDTGVTRLVRGEAAPQGGQEEKDRGGPPLQTIPEGQALDAAHIPPALRHIHPSGLPLRPRSIQRAQKHTHARAPGDRGSAAAPEAPPESRSAEKPRRGGGPLPGTQSLSRCHRAGDPAAQGQGQEENPLQRQEEEAHGQDPDNGEHRRPHRA